MDGHVRVDESRKPRRFVAQWRDAGGRRHKHVLGPAHVKFSGRRNARGGKVWHAGDGPCPDGYITPKRACELLAECMASTPTKPELAEPRHAGAADAVTLAELFEALLERRRRQGRAPSTVADYEDMSRRLGRELGDDTPVAEIDVHRLERMVVEFTAERRISAVSAAQRRSQGATVVRRDGLWTEVSPAAPRTIQKYLVWLHAAFKLALKKNWVALNPVADMDEDLRPRVKRRELTRDEFYSPAEVDRLLAACEEERQRALLGLACYAGLRLGEIRGLRVGGVSFAGQRLHISDNIVRGRLKKPKSGVGRDVPLAAELAALLRPLTTGRHPDQFVLLAGSGTPVYESLAGEWFHAARNAAGLKRLQLRMCRHSFGTACAVAGVDVRTLQKWMGHASVTTTEIYMAYAPKPEEAAMVSRAFRLDSGPVDLAA